MQHPHSIREKIATLRQREYADECELQYLADAACFGSDYIDDLVELLGDARTVEGGTDERTYHRGVVKAGFGTAYRY